MVHYLLTSRFMMRKNERTNQANRHEYVSENGDTSSRRGIQTEALSSQETAP